VAANRRVFENRVIERETVGRFVVHRASRLLTAHWFSVFSRSAQAQRTKGSKWATTDRGAGQDQAKRSARQQGGNGMSLEDAPTGSAAATTHARSRRGPVTRKPGLITPARAMAVLVALLIPACLAQPAAADKYPGAGPGVNVICAQPGYGCALGGYNAQTAPQQSWAWSMSGSKYVLNPPHNCTLYVAWRLEQNGAPKPTWSANAGDWWSAAANARTPSGGVEAVVNGVPAVGSIADWTIPGTDGHVAYVDAVASDGSWIQVSADNYPTGGSWGNWTVQEQINRGTPAWPGHFIHYWDTPPPPPPGPITYLAAADFNADNIINIIDLSVLLKWFGKLAPPGPWMDPDLNHDGHVNIVDLSILLSHWEASGYYSASQAIHHDATPSPPLHAAAHGRTRPHAAAGADRGDDRLRLSAAPRIAGHADGRDPRRETLQSAAELCATARRPVSGQRRILGPVPDRPRDRARRRSHRSVDRGGDLQLGVGPCGHRPPDSAGDRARPSSRSSRDMAGCIESDSRAAGAPSARRGRVLRASGLRQRLLPQHRRALRVLTPARSRASRRRGELVDGHQRRHRLDP
jgi:surface antigen